MNNRRAETYIAKSIELQYDSDINKTDEKWCDEVEKHFSFFPKKLYRYAKLNKYTLDSIDKNYVYLCPAFKLDDQFECRIIDTIKNDIKNISIKDDAFIDGLTKRIMAYPGPISEQQCKSLIRACVFNSEDKDIERFFKKHGNSFEKKNATELKQMALDAASAVSLDDKTQESLEKLFKTAYTAYEGVGIGSLTECDRNQVMWEMYAKHYSGVCIEYDFSDDFNVAANTYPVVYHSSKNSDLLMDVIGMQLDGIVFSMSNGAIRQFQSSQNYMEVFLTKYKEWAFQKEWRIIGNPGDRFEVPKIKRIFVGKNVSPKQLEKLKTIATKNGIKLYQQYDDYETLQIRYKPLE